MDYSKLTDEQLALAEKIGKRAKEKGLNPDFVLSLVMAESGFDPKAHSKKGAIGVMQLMPDTAKSLRVDPHNVDENIDGGLNLLKELVSNKKIGNDPYKVLAAYNTSTATRNKFFESGDLSVLPDETINYMAKVSEFFGGALPSATIGESQPDKEKPEEEIPSNPQPIPDPDSGGPSDKSDQMALAYGTKGALLATGIEGTKQLYSAGRSMLGNRGGSETASRPMNRDNLQRYLNSQLADDLKIPLKDFEKMAGNGKPMRTMAEIQSGLNNIRGTPAQRTQRPSGTYTTTPAKAPIDLSAYKSTPTIMSKAGDTASAAAGVAKTVAPPVARIGFGALGGALAGSQLYDAFNDYREEGGGLPSPRTASRFASGAGGALSMLPFGVTQGLGAALQVPEAAYQLKEYRDRLRAGPQQDTDRIYLDNPMP